MKQKKKIVLLHGALGSKNQFKALKPLLKAKFEIYDLNFEGHGGNPITSDFSVNLFTKNVLDFMESKSIQNITIFGFSMGGYFA